MTKLFLEALKKLPDEFVRDGTTAIEMRDGVVAAHPMLTPIKYQDGEWKPLKIRPGQRIEIVDRERA